MQPGLHVVLANMLRVLKLRSSAKLLLAGMLTPEDIEKEQHHICHHTILCTVAAEGRQRREQMHRHKMIVVAAGAAK